MIDITYADDDIWIASKKLAELSGNKNDWTVVITNYNLYGVLHVKLEFVDKDNTPYRLLANTDHKKCVCLSRQGEITYLAREDVIAYRKFFEFIEETGDITESKTEEPINGFCKIRYIK